MISVSEHYATAVDDGDGIPAPSLQNQDVILEAWHEVLGQVLPERDNEWKQQLRAVKAESTAAVAELRATAASHSCVSPQYASCSENFAIQLDVSGQTLRRIVESKVKYI